MVRLLILLMVISILAFNKKVNTGLFANGHQMLKELGWLEISIIGENNFELKQAYGGTWEISIPGMLPVGSKVKVKLLFTVW